MSSSWGTSRRTGSAFGEMATDKTIRRTLRLGFGFGIFLPSEDRSHDGGHGGGGVTQQEARRQNAANVIVHGQGSGVEVRAVTVVASKLCRSRSRTRVQTAHGMLFSKMRQRRDI